MRLFLFHLFLLCLFATLSAQDCVPDPRPAIFYEDFGNGSGNGDALVAGTTTYAHGSINTGSYVVSNTTNLDPGFWHDGIDNTPNDTNGYMVIFNTSPGNGEYYQRTFEGLCPNTDYIFSAYIANIVVPVACIGVAFRPDVQFTVFNPGNGAVIAQDSTGEIFYDSFLTWREYSIRFSTGIDQTSAQIQLTNNAETGCGNDLAIDDVSLRLCNVVQEQVLDLCDLPGGSLPIGENTYTQPGIYEDALPVPNSCNDTLLTTTLTGENRVLPTISYSFCQGDTLVIDNQLFTNSVSFVDTLAGATEECPLFQPYEIVAQGEAAFTQQISLCAGDSIRVGNNSYINPGTYTDELTTSAGCDSVVVTTITVAEIEVSLNIANAEVALGEAIPLEAEVSGSTDFSLSWLPNDAFSCADCFTPLLQASSSGIYQLIATDNDTGCTASASVIIEVLSCEDVYVPNAFSPNFDQVNDHLQVFAEACFTQLISWQIFDRWGGVVYEASEQLLTGKFDGWDGLVNGEAAEQGTYGYQLMLEREDGSQKLLRGEVMLLR
ncbi:MAG: gliding motility-associated C-terminal domain-containing protein [Bacteroidota bacterium]